MNQGRVGNREVSVCGNIKTESFKAQSRHGGTSSEIPPTPTETVKNNFMRIEKKIRPEFFDKISSGEKNFELRLADWECVPGDILVLREWDPEKKDYSGRVLEKEVSYILKTKDVKFFTPEEVEKYGWQIISFK